MKRGIQLGWQFLVPLILAVIVLLLLFTPTASWPRKIWDDFSKKIEKLWKTTPPVTIKPEDQYDELNKAIRDKEKLTCVRAGCILSGVELEALKNNMRVLQYINFKDNKYYLIKSLIPGHTVYMVYMPTALRLRIGVLDFTVDEKDTRLRSIDETLPVKEIYVEDDYDKYFTPPAIVDLTSSSTVKVYTNGPDVPVIVLPTDIQKKVDEAIAVFNKGSTAPK
jgi:hypothetical protein